MSNEPKNTAQKPKTQTGLCSAISKTLCLKSPKGHEEHSSSPAGPDKTNTENGPKEKKERKKGNDIKAVVKKLKKDIALLPKALQSPYAYEKGKKSCETCNMDKEKFKTVLKSIKIIELVVDNVISKEQKEMLDKEDEQQNVNEPNETASKKEENKVTIQFKVYSEKNIDHNLKCVLIKLQKAIGDTLLQLCYCKSKKFDEKCKNFDVSMNVLEHLKFEYTNLTNSIIRLFKAAPKQKTPPTVCVECMKEDITDCTETLEKMLRDGRNLKVTMRNDDEGKEKCCSRDYPHIHATVHDRHVVLKFELPFEVTPPSKIDKNLEDEENRSQQLSDGGHDEQSRKKKPEDAFSGKPLEKGSSTETKRTENIQPGTLPPVPEKASTLSVKSFASRGSKVSKISSVASQQKENKEEKSSLSPSHGSDAVSGDKSSKKGTTEADANKEPKENEDVLPQKKKPSDASSSDVSESSSLSAGSMGKRKDPNTEQEKNKDVNSKQPLSSTEKDMNKDDSSKKPKKRKTSSEESDSDDDESSTSTLVGSTDSITPIKRKQVSFNPDGPNPSVFFMGTNTHSVYKMGETKTRSVFQTPDNQEQMSALPKKSSLIKGKAHESTVSAVDSVILVKNKYSISGKSKTWKEPGQSRGSGNPYFKGPQQVLRVDTKTVGLERKPSTSLNKQQVSDMLKDLGTNKLLSVNFPAECCKDNIPANSFKCISDLPFSASLHSLPLDQDDLDHITRVVEKFVSNEDTVLRPEGKDESEIEHASQKEENKQEQHQAFTALPTIDKVDEDKSKRRLRSVSGSEDEGIKNRNDFTKISKTAETRFFTVEYPNVFNKATSAEHDCTKGKLESKSYIYHRQCHKHVDKYFKINPQMVNENTEGFETGNMSDEDFISFCYPPITTQSTTHSSEARTLFGESLEKKLWKANKNHNLNPLDEMLMHNVIYLNSNSRKNQTVSKNSKPFNKSQKFSQSISSHGFNQAGIDVKNEGVTINPRNPPNDIIKTTIDSETKQGLTLRNKPNPREEIYIPLNNQNYTGFFILPDNNMSTSENKKYRVLNSDVDNLSSNNLKLNPTNDDSHANIEVVANERIPSDEVGGKHENEELRNNSSLGMHSVANIPEVCAAEKLLNDNVETFFSSGNNESLKDLSNCETLDVNGESCNNRLTDFDWQNKEENLKLKGALKVSDGSEFKTKNNSTTEQKINDFIKKENTSQQLSTLKFKSIKEKEVNLKHHEINRRSYFVCKKPIIGKKETSKVKFDVEVYSGTELKDKDNGTLKHKMNINVGKGKQMSQLSSSGKNSSIPSQNKIKLLRHNLNRRSYFILKKPIIKIVDNVNKHQDNTYQQQRTPTGIKSRSGLKSVKFKISIPDMKFPRIFNVVSNHEIPFLLLSQKNRDIEAKEDFGLLKSYISVKTPKKVKFVTDLPSNEKVQNCVPEKKSLESVLYRNSSGKNFQATIVDVQANDKDQSLSSKYENIFHLFDVSGPLLTGSGGTLKNFTVETQLEIDGAGDPLDKLRSGSVFDTSSHSVGEEGMYPVSAPYSYVLKSISPVGDPIIL